MGAEFLDMGFSIMGLRRLLGLKRPKAESTTPPSITSILQRRAEETSADFVEQHLSTAIIFKRREHLWKLALDEAPKDGVMLEFGVYEGRSINALADMLASNGDGRRLWGFDAFQGLEERWTGVGLPPGHLHRGGKLPGVRPSVKLVPGWISDTLPGFLAEVPGPIAFMHIDTVTYKPAKIVLSLCKGRLQPGCMVVLDDLLGYPGWKNGEFRALHEEIEADRYEWVGFCEHRGLIRVL